MSLCRCRLDRPQGSGTQLRFMRVASLFSNNHRTHMSGSYLIEHDLGPPPSQMRVQWSHLDHPKCSLPALIAAHPFNCAVCGKAIDYCALAALLSPCLSLSHDPCVNR
jgi:hypothetical protein